MATLVVVALAAATGVAFPDTPPGRPLRDWLGGGALLAAAWPAWLAWRLVRGGNALRPGLLAALLVLSSALLVALAARDPAAGGTLGMALLDALVAGFGRASGLALLAALSLAALLVVLGPSRVLAALAALGSLVRRPDTTPREPAPRGAVPVPMAGEPRPTRGLAEPASPPTRSAPADPGHDLVILGPRGARPDAPPTPAAAPAAPPRPTSPPPRPATSPYAPTDWHKPAGDLLSTGGEGGAFSPADLRARARIIEDTLASFGVQARVAEVQQGPAITQFGLDPAPGVPVNKIVARQNDLALRLGAPSLRVLAPVPGRPLVGLEVPNASVATVKLGDLVGAPPFSRARLPLAIGMDVSGKPVVGDLARMPHLLIAGATGAGKSVCINTIIASLLISRTPDEVQLVLVDPKQVEMTQYKGLPHLRLPVVTDMDKVVATLRWTVLEMEKRYTRFSEVGARNILAFNERFPDERLSYLVVVIDELADMMMTAAEDVERQICRLAQLGRAAGVHLVVATQRPSVDVLTGLIKANLPTRIAFAVSSQTDSRVILDRVGAERLLGRGDALYQPGDEMNPRRVQGAFVSDEEIEALCSHWRAQGAARHTAEDEEQLERLARQDDPEEKLLAQAREILEERGGDVSVGYLQRRLKVGQQKAARIHQTLMADEAAAYALPPLDD